MRGVRSYHINEPTCIDASNEITHRTVEGEIKTDTLLPPVRADRLLRIGVTSGASTPDHTVQEALSRIVLLHEVEFNSVKMISHCGVVFLRVFT